MEYRDHQKGKCETCGFLSKHGRGVEAPTPRFYEIESSERTSANSYFTYYTPTKQHVSTEMACYQHKANFMAEINRLVDQGERDRKIVGMVRQDRHCDAWYPYKPGLSPKEHYEQLVMQKLEADRRAYEERTEESRRRYEERMVKEAEADRRRHEELNEGRNRTLIVASIILAVIIGLAEILAAIILNRESPTDQLLRKLLGQ